MEIVQVAEWTVDFGGEEPTGWLPKEAVPPLPTPVVRADLALAILKDGTQDADGFILEWRGPTKETSGDTWHSSLADAVTWADQHFGVPEDAWVKTGATKASG